MRSNARPSKVPASCIACSLVFILTFSLAWPCLGSPFAFACKPKRLVHCALKKPWSLFLAQGEGPRHEEKRTRQKFDQNRPEEIVSFRLALQEKRTIVIDFEGNKDWEQMTRVLAGLVYRRIINCQGSTHRSCQYVSLSNNNAMPVFS